jgi:magnesium chelatase family protein
MLVAAMNPCPCGFLGDVKRECTCSPLQIQRYRAKISGPLLDRIDIHLEVPAVPYRELSGISEGESSPLILERVVRAREIQEERFSRAKIFHNAGMNSRHLKKYCPIDAESGVLLERAMERFGLSARAHARILKIARTIADLEGSKELRAAHVGEAIQYRTLDRKMT